jgi:hypothetical protein
MENDFIVGLPAIIGELYDYFKDMLSKARILADKMIHIENQQSISRVISVNLNSVVILEPGQMLEPWQYPVIAPAPEETLTVEPVNFSYALHYLEIGHEEAVKEYLSLLDEHVSPAMKANTDIMHLMKNKGLKVFVPTNWDGIY